ncbi:hypothetical protein MRX96_043809 [Rhipicephalus microplus]
MRWRLAKTDPRHGERSTARKDNTPPPGRRRRQELAGVLAVAACAYLAEAVPISPRKRRLVHLQVENNYCASNGRERKIQVDLGATTRSSSCWRDRRALAPR